MRTIIDLPAEQVAALGKFCKSLGISRAEAVRRAVVQLLVRREEENRENAFGAWRKNKLNASKFVREIRDEWES